MGTALLATPDIPFDAEPMKWFSGFEYILIDIASQWGLDKETFERRLEWAENHIDQFEVLADERGHWKEKPLYLKAVMTLRRVQEGQPTGHMVGFDAVCSGMQVLSVISGCEAGAHSTGLVDPDVRADAYTACTRAMQRHLPALPDEDRKAIKQAVMTCLYGSKAIPEQLFGKGTKELHVFHQALMEIAPGACRLIDVLTHVWRPFAKAHVWVLPDNHHADVAVMEMKETQIEVDELDHAKFTYRYQVNEGAQKGISLIANVTHSIDAYVLRSLIRRCNYDLDVTATAAMIIDNELIRREQATKTTLAKHLTPAFVVLLDRYTASKMPDTTILKHLTADNVKNLTVKHLQALQRITQQMLCHQPFPILCVHDEFKCSPNRMNYLRLHYREIMAQLAESEILNDIIQTISGAPVTVRKRSTTLASKIRRSNYGIC